MKASSRIDRTPPLVRRSRTRSPIQNAWNGDRGVSPNLIGLRSDLFEHVEVVLMTRLPHSLEDADVAARNVRHAQAEHRFKSIRTHQRRVPRVTLRPSHAPRGPRSRSSAHRADQRGRRPFAAACTRLRPPALSCVHSRAYPEQLLDIRPTRRLSSAGATCRTYPETRGRKERLALPLAQLRDKEMPFVATSYVLRPASPASSASAI